MDRLLAQEQDENVRRDLLFRQIDDSYATIMRQAFFALFERNAHEMVQPGASVDALANAYLQNLQQQFSHFTSNTKPRGMHLSHATSKSCLQEAPMRPIAFCRRRGSTFQMPNSGREVSM